ncbi:MAG: C4-dicarboxylate ABC transporter permease [Burkholderiales bacterium RIFCSPHIGHO2_12_FULL_61_11]|nr:MAG: C4-dicarboxylate ABC transporter permease [Burkholderiales bacterium RIFCSPHIGHO2_12_FULL_61_11]
MTNRASLLTVRSIEAVIDAIGRAASWVALLIIVLMTCNVLLRYTFNYGTVWGQELEWHLMGALILFGMSYASLKDGHVRVDLFYAHYSKKTKLLVDVLSLLLQIGICCVIIWLSMNYVEQSYSIGEISADPGGLPYRWAIKALLPIGFTLLLIQSIGELLRLCMCNQEKSEETHA